MIYVITNEINKIKLQRIIKILVASQAIIIPIQIFMHTIFKLPTCIQFYYLFLVLNFLVLLNFPIKKWFLSQKKYFLIFFLFFIFILVLSSIVNLETTIEKGFSFKYYIRIYDLFWDAPVNRAIWGILNNILLFVYIFELFILLNLKGMLKLFLKSVIMLGIVSSVYSIYQFIAGFLDLPLSSIFSGHSGEAMYLFGKIRRVEGVFYEPGPQAAFLSAIFSILLLQLPIKNKQLKLFSRNFNNISLVIVGITLILTFSPIGIFAYMLSFAFFALLNYKTIKKCFNLKKLLKYLSFLCIVILFLTTFINKLSFINNYDITEYLKQRVVSGTFGGLDDPYVYTNSDQRSVRNYVGICIFKDFPILGCGPNNAILYFYKYAPFAIVYKKVNNTIEPTLRDKGAVLNQHIKILCETGILGFLFYLLILIYPIYLYLKNQKYIFRSSDKFLIQGLLIGHLIYILVSMQTTFQLYQHTFWFNYIPLVILSSKQIVKTEKFNESNGSIYHEE